MKEEEYYRIKSYTEVERYIEEVHKRVRKGLFKVSEREDKNLPFLRAYNLVDKGRQAKILLKLCPEDFLHAVPSRLEGNEGQELYVFVKKFPLHKMMKGMEEVWVYTKIDLIVGSSQNAIIVSFHPAEHIPKSFPFQ